MGPPDDDRRGFDGVDHRREAPPHPVGTLFSTSLDSRFFAEQTKDGTGNCEAGTVVRIFCLLFLAVLALAGS